MSLIAPQRRVTITQQNKNIIVEFQELLMHRFESIYYKWYDLDSPQTELSSLIFTWINGKDIEADDLMIAE